jgi:hypothetical protein
MSRRVDRVRHRAVSLALLVLSTACQRDDPFHTVAVYEAPRGRYSLRIEAEGRVRAGHDLSEQALARVAVTPLPGAPPSSASRLTFTVSLRDGRIQFGNDSGSEPSAAALSRRLAPAGYSVNADEAEEMASACEGALLGPKGTLMTGQTKTIRVVSTAFER